MIIDGRLSPMLGAGNLKLGLAYLLKYELLKRHYWKLREKDLKGCGDVDKATASNKPTEN